MYATDLQKNILEAERKAAKIEIKPMPADFFPAGPGRHRRPRSASPAATKSAAPKP